MEAINVISDAAAVLAYKPTDAKKSINTNDVKAFVYDWFAQFTHLTAAEWFLKHFDERDMFVDFPGLPMRDHHSFKEWYETWQTFCEWEFQDIIALKVTGTAETAFMVEATFIHIGEVFDKEGAQEFTGIPPGPFSRLLKEIWRLEVDHTVKGAPFYIRHYRAELL